MERVKLTRHGVEKLWEAKSVPALLKRGWKLTEAPAAAVEPEQPVVRPAQKKPSK